MGHDPTERIIGLVRRERNRQRRFNFTDDTKTKGELSGAAACYAGVAQRQIKLRDHEKVKDLQERIEAAGGRASIPAGGVTNGYPKLGPFMNKPKSWLVDSSWLPSDPKSNLVRAAALIIAELERMEREDKKLFATKEKTKREQPKYNEVYGGDVYADIADTLIAQSNYSNLSNHTLQYNSQDQGVWATKTLADFKASIGLPDKTGCVGTDPSHGGKVYWSDYDNAAVPAAEASA